MDLAFHLELTVRLDKADRVLGIRVAELYDIGADLVVGAVAVVLGEQVLFEEQAAGLALAFLKVLDPGLEAAQDALLG